MKEGGVSLRTSCYMVLTFRTMVMFHICKKINNRPEWILKKKGMQIEIINLTIFQMNNVIALWGGDGDGTLVTFEHSIVTPDS